MESRSKMFVEVLAVLLALSHVATIAALVLWFGLGKPKSRKDFWLRFKGEFFSLTPQARR